MRKKGVPVQLYKCCSWVRLARCYLVTLVTTDLSRQLQEQGKAESPQLYLVLRCPMKQWGRHHHWICCVTRVGTSEMCPSQMRTQTQPFYVYDGTVGIHMALMHCNVPSFFFRALLTAGAPTSLRTCSERWQSLVVTSSNTIIYNCRASVVIVFAWSLKDSIWAGLWNDPT